MLSFIQPSFFNDFVSPFSRRRQFYQPREGIPYIFEDDSYWHVKTYLPDVHEDEFTASIVDNTLFMKWNDCKKIKHNGRIYESKKLFEESINLPDGITEDMMKVTWNDKFAIISITKPVEEDNEVEEEMKDNEPFEGTLVRMALPSSIDNHDIHVNIDGNQLTMVFESNDTKEEDGNYSRYHTKIQRTIPIPQGIKESDIDTEIKDGELIVSVKKALPAPEEPKPIENKSINDEIPEEEEKHEELENDVDISDEIMDE